MHYLQQLTQWPRKIPNFAVGNLVLVKNNLLPPAQWMMARVIALHPGADNLVRVVTLRTASGTLQRPVVKLCLLPVNAETTIPPKD